MRLAVITGFVVSALLPLAVAAQNAVHMYTQPDGTRLFTDQKRSTSGYTYLGRYGRQPFRVSCAAYDPVIMEGRRNTYRPLIEQYAEQHGLDPVLVIAVMRVESCLDRNAVSRAGARGLMQLMPATAHELGVRDIFDPAENIRGGTTYLAQMLKRFNNTELALAAYNAGPGAVERHKGIPPYKETQKYVKRVLRQYQVYLASR